MLAYFNFFGQQQFDQPGFAAQMFGQREDSASDAAIPPPPKKSRVEPEASASVGVMEPSDVEDQLGLVQP
jgi:hypothetical protein